MIGVIYFIALLLAISIGIASGEFLFAIFSFFVVLIGLYLVGVVIYLICALPLTILAALTGFAIFGGDDEC